MSTDGEPIRDTGAQRVPDIVWIGTHPDLPPEMWLWAEPSHLNARRGAGWTIAPYQPAAPTAGEGDADGGIDWMALSPEEYSRIRRERLDAKVEELRAAGWDVIARRERDLALLQRDEARDDLAANAAPTGGEGDDAREGAKP